MAKPASTNRRTATTGASPRSNVPPLDATRKERDILGHGRTESTATAREFLSEYKIPHKVVVDERTKDADFPEGRPIRCMNAARRSSSSRRMRSSGTKGTNYLQAQRECDFRTRSGERALRFAVVIFKETGVTFPRTSETSDTSNSTKIDSMRS